jgi:DHA2 family multidrug resistance protein-like MFS transporter
VLGIFVSQGAAQQIRPAYVMTAGALVAAVGMSILTQVSASTGLALLLAGFTVVYIGVSPVGPLVAQLVVPSAPPEKAGSAASLQATSGELGVALGLAVLGSIGMAVYRREVTVPAEAVGTPAGQAAGETIAGAMEVAQSLPPAVAGPLVESARAAFSSGLNTAAVICAVAFVGLALLAVATLRHIPPMGARPTEPAPGARAGAGAGDAVPAPAESPEPDPKQAGTGSARGRM